jgi:hypothetical protein
MAHLIKENGALAEDRHGDYNGAGNPCSLGMLQWNTCIHYGKSVHRWLNENPKWRDWRFQVRFYLDQMQGRIAKYKSVDRAIRSWNYNAGQQYVDSVHRHIYTIRVLLND